AGHGLLKSNGFVGNEAHSRQCQGQATGGHDDHQQFLADQRLVEKSHDLSRTIFARLSSLELMLIPERPAASVLISKRSLPSSRTKLIIPPRRRNFSSSPTVTIGNFLASIRISSIFFPVLPMKRSWPVSKAAGKLSC